MQSQCSAYSLKFKTSTSCQSMCHEIAQIEVAPCFQIISITLAVVIAGNMLDKFTNILCWIAWMAGKSKISS